MSQMYSWYRNWTTTLCCGIQAVISPHSDWACLVISKDSFRYVKLQNFCFGRWKFVLWISPLCQIMSNDWATSIKNVQQSLLSLMLFSMILFILWGNSMVESLLLNQNWCFSIISFVSIVSFNLLNRCLSENFEIFGNREI